MGDKEDVIALLTDLQEDSTVPRNVKTKVENTLNALKEDGEISIVVSKALNELEEIADDPNMQMYTRTQIWNVISILEKMGNGKE